MKLFWKKASKSNSSKGNIAADRRGKHAPARMTPIALFEELEGRQMFSAVTGGPGTPWPPTGPSASSAITAEYSSLPAAVKSILGHTMSGIVSVPGAGGAEMQSFQSGGAIYWSASTGAHLEYGGIGGEYQSVKGIVGFPTSDEGNAAGLPAGTRVQTFQYGTIYWSATTGGHAVYGGIGNEYGSVKSILGSPTSDEANAAGFPAGTRVQTFQYGTIYWSAGTGAHAVYGGIGNEYGSVKSILGLPISDEANAAGFPAGTRVQTFQNGTIYWSASTGAHAVYYGIRAEYNSAAGILGLPIGDEGYAAGFPAGTRVQTFQNGTIYWSASTGAHAVYGGIRAEYNSVAGILGLPTGDEANIWAIYRTARVQTFQNGVIYWSASTGAHAVYGGINWTYENSGGASVHGLPTDDEGGPADDRGQDFENGRLVWTPANGAVWRSIVF